jgi:hypothetical protein
LWVCTQKEIPTFRAAFLSIPERQELLKYPPMNEQINKMWNIYKDKYHSALKRKELWNMLQHG